MDVCSWPGASAGAARRVEPRSKKRFANLFELREGRVARLVLYEDRDRAFADLGLEE